jgi:hypothetical protein
VSVRKKWFGIKISIGLLIWNYKNMEVTRAKFVYLVKGIFRLCNYHNYSWRQDNSVDIVTRQQAGQRRNRGSIPDSGKSFLLNPKGSSSTMGPPSFLFSEYQKLLFRENGTQKFKQYSSQYSTKVTNEWSYTSTLHIPS